MVERIRPLGPRHPDATIARLLTREGIHSGKGHRFTTRAVSWIRFAYQLRKRAPLASRPRTSTAVTHEQLNLY